MTTTFEDAKVGDQLWSVEFGWGEVVSRDTLSQCFTVEFNHDEFETYSFKGTRKRPIREKMQTLFWDEVKFKAPVKPLPDLEVDTKVLVWRDDGTKHNRYFAGWSAVNGLIMTYDYGATSWSGIGFTTWPNWELAE